MNSVYSTIQGTTEVKSDPKQAEPSKKRRKSVNGNTTEDEDSGLESFDWWTKYHASLESNSQVGSAVSIFCDC